MLYKNYLFAISILLFFASCNQTVNPGGKIWFYTHSTATDPAFIDTTLNPACFIELRKDGSYSSDLGHFEDGKWLFSNNQVFLTTSSGEKKIIPVVYLTAKEMQTGPAKGPFDNFESQPGNFANTLQDPFAIDNNVWRLKAKAKENRAQLKDRLRNHCRFWQMYFNWALENKIDYIDVRSTPSPIKIYGNGFALKPYEHLPTAWKLYFFDEDDCRQANNMIKTVFDNGSIAWPHTDNKYKMFISAFQQMEKLIQ